MKQPKVIVVTNRRDDVVRLALVNGLDLHHVLWVGERGRLYGLRPAPGDRVFTIGSLSDDLRDAVKAWATHTNTVLERIEANDVIVPKGVTLCGFDH